MNKVWLIFKREYISRVKTKSFILSTLLVPLALILLMAGMIFIAVNSSEKLQIAVKDESGLFRDKFRGLDQGDKLRFKYRKDESLETLKEDVEQGRYDGVLYIPYINLDQPRGIKFFSEKQIGSSTKSVMTDAVTDVIKTRVLEREGYDDKLLAKLEEKVFIESVIKKETKSGVAEVASGIGYIMGFIIYIYLFTYGAMVMKGVAEEKTNRIVEVILSSVKPLQLMMGKIIGIGFVGITQFSIWIVTIVGVQFIAGLAFGSQLQDLQDVQAGTGAAPSEAFIADIVQSISELNLTRLVFSFFIYFAFGYLFYASQFAAVGAATTDDSDANAYTFPIAMPIILAIVIMGVAIDQPAAPIAFWGSIIPFFSPVVMLARLPFEVSWSEQLLSMSILAISSIAMVWLASRIYRVGILIQGKKVSFKDLGKWIFSSY